MKSLFDFIERTEAKSIADCPETQKLDKRLEELGAELDTNLS